MFSFKFTNLSLCKQALKEACRRLTTLASLGVISTALLALTSLISSEALADDGLEAVIAPQITMAIGGGSRTRYGIDFYRVSTGPSLSIHYGTGGNYNDLTALFRISNHFSLNDSGNSTGIIYGLGVGYTWAMDSTDEAKDSFASVSLNPYARYLFDFNGRIGTYLELGYEFSVAGLKYGINAPAKTAIRSNSNKFIIAIGFPFEAERPRSQ